MIRQALYQPARMQAASPPGVRLRGGWRDGCSFWREDRAHQWIGDPVRQPHGGAGGPRHGQALGIAFVQTPGVAPSVRGAGFNQLVFENMTDNPVGTGLSKPLQIGSIGEAGVYLTAMVHGLDGGRTLLFSYTVYRD